MARLYASSAEPEPRANSPVAAAEGAPAMSRGSSRAARAVWCGGLLRLSVQDLVAELKSMHEFLSPIDQDDVDRAELQPLAAQLADAGLIRHKDRAVRVLVACALANILRLFAPDAPYTREQLGQLFGLFVQQLRGVGEPGGPYYAYHYFLLESLSTVKSVVLVFELEEGAQLQHQLISLAFELVHPTLQKNVRLYLGELAQTLLEEGDAVPGGLVEELLIGGIAGTGANASATALAQDLVRQCGARLQGAFGQHFHAQLGRAGAGRDAHEFAVRLLGVSRGAGATVLRLLEEELRAEDAEQRAQAIEALGRVFAGQAAPGRAFGSAYEGWLQRRQDKAARCRGQWAQGACAVLGAALRRGGDAGAVDALAPLLAARLEDPEERVRVACLQGLARSVLPEARAAPRVLVEAVAGRCMDRREEVQQEARALAAAWLLACARDCATADAFCACTGDASRTLVLAAFAESRAHALAALSFLDVHVLAPLCALPRATERRLWLLEAARTAGGACAPQQQQQVRSALQAALRHKAQFGKAWLALAKLARMPRPLSGVLQARSLQLARLVAELLPGAGARSADAQRALLGLAELPGALRDAVVAASEARGCGGPEWRRALAQLQGAPLPRALQDALLGHGCCPGALALAAPLSLPPALIAELSALAGAPADPLASAAAAHLQDILAEFPQLFADRLEELVGAAVRSAGDPGALAALAAYTAAPRAAHVPVAPLPAPLAAQLAALLDGILGGAGALEPKRAGAAALVAVQLGLRELPALVQQLVLRLGAEGDAPQRAAAALAALVRGIPEAAGTLVPHFDALLALVAGRLCPEALVAGAEGPGAGRCGRARAALDAPALLDAWPHVAALPPALQRAVLGVRLLVALVGALIRQHTRLAGCATVPDLHHGGLVDLDVVSSVRSAVVGFLLSRTAQLGAGVGTGGAGGGTTGTSTTPTITPTTTPTTTTTTARLRYALLKGLLTCLPDASAADACAHLLAPLLPALQDSQHALRLKLVLLLGRLVRARRIAEAFTPLLVFAGAHERVPAIRAAARSALAEAEGVRARAPALLPVLAVYVAQYADHVDVARNAATRALVLGHVAFFCDVAVGADTCGAVYAAAGRLKLHGIPGATRASRRLYCVAELAQHAVRQHAALHHWPLDDAPGPGPALALLVPDVLQELPEPAQLANMHRSYLDEPELSDGDDAQGDEHADGNSSHAAQDGIENISPSPSTATATAPAKHGPPAPAMVKRQRRAPSRAK